MLAYAGSWYAKTDGTFSGGSIKNTYQTGSSVTATFVGTRLTWIARTGPSYGMARVTLDGGTPLLVDLYRSSFLNQQQVWTTGTLSNGTHTVTIEWTGQKNTSATYTYVGVDAFDVMGALTSTGVLGVGVQM